MSQLAWLVTQFLKFTFAPQKEDLAGATDIQINQETMIKEWLKMSVPACTTNTPRWYYNFQSFSIALCMHAYVCMHMITKNCHVVSSLNFTSFEVLKVYVWCANIILITSQCILVLEWTKGILPERSSTVFWPNTDNFESENFQFLKILNP